VRKTASTEATRPPFWRDIRVLRVLGQAVFVVVLVLFFRELADNLESGLRRQNQRISFDFLGRRAGFGISEGLDYSPNQTFLRAGIVGLWNTIRVSAVGIVLAFLLGLIMGVARLSPNWLLRRIAQMYVDVIRNTPVLVQIIFWAVAILGPLGPPTDGDRGMLIVSNRLTALAWPRVGEGGGVFWGVMAAGLVVALLVWRWRTRVWEQTGAPPYRYLGAFGVLLVSVVVGQVVSGGAVGMDVPHVEGRTVIGGVAVTAQYAALLLGLVVYTGAFIAEIVRGSILAVEKGQKEAGEAIGLRPGQQLRFVVLPQAMRIAIPPINSQFLNLTKNSSLASAIAYPDLVNIARTIINQAGGAFQVLILVMAAYLTLSLFISFCMNMLNRAVAYRGVRT
jgi:general L-amino acid transport system permease protein